MQRETFEHGGHQATSEVAKKGLTRLSILRVKFLIADILLRTHWRAPRVHACYVRCLCHEKGRGNLACAFESPPSGTCAGKARPTMCHKSFCMASRHAHPTGPAFAVQFFPKSITRRKSHSIKCPFSDLLRLHAGTEEGKCRLWTRCICRYGQKMVLIGHEKR